MVLLLLLLHSPWAISSDSERNESISDVYVFNQMGYIEQLDSGLATVKRANYAHLEEDIPYADITPNGKEIIIGARDHLYRVDADTLEVRTDKVVAPRGVQIHNVFAVTDDYAFIGCTLKGCDKRLYPDPQNTILWNFKTNEVRDISYTSFISREAVRMSPDFSHLYIMSGSYINIMEWPRCDARRVISLESALCSYDANGYSVADICGWEVDWKLRTHEIWCVNEVREKKMKPVLLKVTNSEDVRKVSTLFTGWPRKGLFRKADPDGVHWQTRIRILGWDYSEDGDLLARCYDKATCRQLSRVGWKWFDDDVLSYVTVRFSPDCKWILALAIIVEDIPQSETKEIAEEDGLPNQDLYLELRAVETETGKMVKAVRFSRWDTSFVIRKR
jgi:hypothetical protein